ncbi:MAG: hypothetical protein F9K14_01005 [Candidatus Methanoperedens sp.]|nr:MAG: hypothetical protein F9K14_01005 [Candidatus Methanoperedens sp.]
MTWLLSCRPCLKINYCRIADWINEDNFIRFTKYLLRLHGKVVLIVDRATHHVKSNKVKMFVKKCKGNIIIWPIPKRLPELSSMEQGWKSSRENITYRLFENQKKIRLCSKETHNKRI